MIVILVVIVILVWPKNPVPKEFRCKTNSDCVLVNICCSCDNGETRGAVAKDYKQWILDKIKINCQKDGSNVCNGNANCLKSYADRCNGTAKGYPACEPDVYAKCWNGYCSISNADPWSTVGGKIAVLN